MTWVQVGSPRILFQSLAADSLDSNPSLGLDRPPSPSPSQNPVPVPGQWNQKNPGAPRNASLSPNGQWLIQWTAMDSVLVLSLWSIHHQPPTLLTQLTLNLDCGAVTSDAYDIQWHPESMALCLLGSPWLWVLHLQAPSGSQALNLTTVQNHCWVRGPGQRSIQWPSLQLHLHQRLFLGEGTRGCLLTTPATWHVLGSLPASLSLSWTADLSLMETTENVDEASLTGNNMAVLVELLEETGGELVSMLHVQSLDLYAFLLSHPHRLYFSIGKYGGASTGNLQTTNMSTYTGRKGILLSCVNPTETLEHTGQHPEYIPTCMDVDPRFRWVAVGCQRGRVYVYQLNDAWQLHFKHQLVGPGLVDVQEGVAMEGGKTNGNDGNTNGQGDVGSALPRHHVSSVAWSSDGLMLAVGWQSGGYAVWSATGTLICATPLGGEEPLSPSLLLSDPYVLGVKQVMWLAGDYQLAVFPVDTETVHQPTKEEEGPSVTGDPFQSRSIAFCVSQFAKHSSVYHTRDNIKHPFLIAQDHILLYAGADTDSAMAANAVFWQTIPIPNTYLMDNFPIRYASISADGRRLAVAGQSGFCHYNLITGKWRLFGNEQQEASFVCRGGLVWFRDLLVVACQARQDGRYSLRFYPSDKNLDQQQVVHVERVGAAVLLLNVYQNLLLVYDEENHLTYYVMHRSRSDFKLKRLGSFFLGDVIQRPVAVQSVDQYVPIGSLPLHPESGEYPPCLVMYEQKLMAVDHQLNEDGEAVVEEVLLSDQVSFFWTLSTRHSLGSLHNSLWAFDGKRTRIWMNLFVETGPQSWVTPWKQPIELSFDFFPLGVVFNHGIVVGVEQAVSSYYQNGLSFKCIPKSHLFLHHIIHWLLAKKLRNEAIVFAQFYSKLDYFCHAMEILLHRVLERECQTMIGFHRDAVLPEVVHFLRAFPEFYEIVVRCARKTEVAMWEYLFSIVGDPKDLFRYCLDTNNFKTATSYLIILQTLEPYSVSSQLQVELLEKTLESEDFTLCGEIVRYLNSVNVGRSPSQELRSEVGRGGLLAISAEDEQTFYIDILISRHARKLMANHQIRMLAKLSTTLGFPIMEWLKKEKNRAALITDLPAVFRKLHVQFEWAYPADSPSPILRSDSKNAGLAKRRSLSSLSSQSKLESQRSSSDFGSREFSGSTNYLNGSNKSQSSSIDSVNAVENSPVIRRRASFAPGLQGRRLSYRVDVESELGFLVSVTKQAKCFSWCLLLATMTLDLGTIIQVLNEAKRNQEFNQLFDDYKKAILSTGCTEYRKLLESVEELVTLS